MANVLDKIVADKRVEVEQRKIDRPLSSFKAEVLPTKRDFYKALAKSETSFILECKKASPSKGLIRSDFNLEEITSVYSRYADCISVLTDEKYFQGSFDYLSTVRQHVEQPIICKDFIVDEYQIYLGRLHGADAVLLMLSVLDDETYTLLSQVATSLNMAVLTEVSNEEEVTRALNLDAQIIGINNRNLRDLSTDLGMTEALSKLIPQDKVVISESGIYTHTDVKRLSGLCHGFLVGSSIMAEADLDLACRKLILGENKVCGLTRIQDAEAAYNSGAVYGGLIFYSKSPRYVDLDCAKAIAESSALNFVGVFVNESIESVAAIAKDLKLVAVQLHGQENQQYMAELESALPSHCKIWKALPVADSLPELPQGADRYLFDTHNGKNSGGTGQVFNWDVLADLPQNTIFMLAGGLSEDNVEQAGSLQAIGLDLNSGVENSPGKKSAEKIGRTFQKIRNY